MVVSRGGQKRALVSRKPTVTSAVPDPQSPSVEAISVKHSEPVHYVSVSTETTDSDWLSVTHTRRSWKLAWMVVFRYLTGLNSNFLKMSHTE